VARVHVSAGRGLRQGTPTPARGLRYGGRHMDGFCGRRWVEGPPINLGRGGGGRPKFHVHRRPLHSTVDAPTARSVSIRRPTDARAEEGAASRPSAAVCRGRVIAAYDSARRAGRWTPERRTLPRNEGHDLKNKSWVSLATMQEGSTASGAGVRPAETLFVGPALTKQGRSGLTDRIADVCAPYPGPRASGGSIRQGLTWSSATDLGFRRHDGGELAVAEGGCWSAAR